MNNKTNKVLLVTFQDNTDVVGLKYIHSYLRGHKIESYMLLLPHYRENDNYKIAKFIKDINPAVMGISLMSDEFFYAKEFTSFIKNEFPGLTVVWGGIHPSIAPAQCLEYADFVFMGESEVAFMEYVEAVFANKPTLSILNLAYKTGDKIVINEARPYIDDLDILPFPEHMPSDSFILHKNRIREMNKSIFEKYARYSGKFYSLLSSRGCPFSCSYCSNSFYAKLYGTSKVRHRSVHNIIEELTMAVAAYPDIIYISIQDENFFYSDIKWMQDFADQYKKAIGGKGFVCSTAPNNVNEEKLSMLRKIGLSWITMGLQTGSQKINREIYRRFMSNETFVTAALQIKKFNIPCLYDVILDNPYETESDVIETIKVLLKIPRPFMLQLFSLCFYYGTEIYEKASKDRILFEDPRKKSYTKYSNTYLNKVIRLTPLLPGRFIMWLVNNRKGKLSFCINLVFLPALFIVEPFVWIVMIFISFDCNVFSTIRMMSSFFNTGFRKVALRK
ncbi:MAG: B12-binding domain-containing radical SAM protein [Candidatus Omnitrophica bacterium]|nr:B12-binding domain-containing radical SAM protein [Candidatus Omnitrophota bacterium]MBU1808072.1 B12-binding domain-containing radical SAM protein [Candidatus Omnitrophota bacterium]